MNRLLIDPMIERTKEARDLHSVKFGPGARVRPSVLLPSSCLHILYIRGAYRLYTIVVDFFFLLITICAKRIVRI